VRDGEGLARAGDAEQHLVALARLEPFRQLRDRLRLVAGGRVVRLDLEALAAFRQRPVDRLGELGGPAFGHRRFQIDGGLGHGAYIAFQGRCEQGPSRDAISSRRPS
jgi:hypothetical protein